MLAPYRKKTNGTIITELQNTTKNTNSKQYIDYNKKACLNNDNKINNLNYPIKRARMAERVKKHNLFSTK